MSIFRNPFEIFRGKSDIGKNGSEKSAELEAYDVYKKTDKEYMEKWANHYMPEGAVELGGDGTSFVLEKLGDEATGKHVDYKMVNGKNYAVIERDFLSKSPHFVEELGDEGFEQVTSGQLNVVFVQTEKKGTGSRGDFPTGADHLRHGSI